MQSSPNMGLTIWDQLSDYFNHAELAANFEALDNHDHTSGKGKQLPEGALAPDSVTGANLKDNSVTGNKLVNGSVSAAKLGASVIGSANLQDGAVTSAKVANDAVGLENLSSSVMEDLGLSEASTVRRGTFVKAASDSRTNNAYGTLTTADQVSNVVLPTDGLLNIAYLAMWSKDTASATASAAIFLNGVQLKSTAAPSPTVQEATISDTDATTGVQWKVLRTNESGLTNIEGAGSYSGHVGTGQILPFVTVFADAGTYTVSVRFKGTGSSTVSAQSRRLLVWTQGF